MTDAVLRLANSTGKKIVALSTYIEGSDEVAASERAIAWIKQLRLAHVDGVPLRQRFTYRGDSLWWFTEIYLHKQQVIRLLFRTIAAVDRLLQTEAPTRIEIDRADPITRDVTGRVAAARRVVVSGGPVSSVYWRARLARLDTRARWLTGAALASRLRSRPRPARTAPPDVAAFIHRAFWREESGDGSAEAYIGPVLQRLEERVGRERLAYVSLGPSENFSARRWWHPLRATDESSKAIPVESFSTLQDLQQSRTVWNHRFRHRQALWANSEVREHALIQQIDCWPPIREELAGIASLQWPWSARAMDEAAAALDALQPRAALTYAEAGGWGRALILECRRRKVPIAGLQHGFIYRHWLNYLHERDEMEPAVESADDAGFPRPDVTTLFDEYAAHHLIERGNFPPDALAITGSPRLDALVRAARGLDAAAIERAAAAAGARSGMLVLVVAKYREAQLALGQFIEAASALRDVDVAIKTHPAETPDVYSEIVAGRQNVTVLPASAPLAPLLRASRAVVTVNSTVALDAAVLGVPALVIGLPNNLSPFVEAGAMAGAPPHGVGEALRQILYDEKFRQQLERARGLFLARFRILSDGGAAERTADAVLTLAG